MKLVVVIQARMSSSRLPGKVMAPVCGRPMLAWMLDRVRLAREPDAVVVATTQHAADAPIVALCEALHVACYRGHPSDCLDRHFRVSLDHHADAIIKIPSDCPLIDPRVIDAVLSSWRRNRGHYDYLSNLHPPTWPDGNDVEVMSARALERAATEASDPFDREHTTPYLWSNPSSFRLGNVRWHCGLDYSRRLRWVVDWPEDLEVVREIFSQLVPVRGVAFSVHDVLALHARQPTLEMLNAMHRGYHYAAGRLGTHPQRPSGPVQRRKRFSGEAVARR